VPDQRKMCYMEKKEGGRKVNIEGEGKAGLETPGTDAPPNTQEKDI